MKQHCPKCRMSFRVEEPPRRLPVYNATPVTRCSEPSCGQRFWHGARVSEGPIIVGIFPEDARSIE